MNWQNLIAHRADVDPLELLPQEHNFRIHALPQRHVTTASLDELGHVGDIIVNIRTGKIVNGHLRVELSIAEDQRTVPVTYIDCDVATEQIILAFFDQVGAKAITDAARLQKTMAQITTGSSHLQASLDDWLLSFAPKKGTKGAPVDDDEDEALDDDLGFVGDAPLTPAPPAVAPLGPTRAAEQAGAGEVVPATPAAPLGDASASSAPQAPALDAAPLRDATPPVALDAVQAVPSQVEAGDTPEEVPVALVAPVAAPLPVLTPDSITAAIVDDVRAAAAAEDPAAARAPLPPTVAAPTEYLVKVGEFDQLIPAAQFAPWFAALCAAHGNGSAQLATELKRRLSLG